MMKKNSHVCFQMDTDHRITSGEKGCDWGMKYKSVVGYGRLSAADTDEERRKGLDLIMDQYGGSGKYDYDPKLFSRTMVLRLEIIEISAKEA
jgi:nitroimidazol reductase NimA-like FMN-containing flavoprotein (pyridoxamine 5'-phosphate oxidase superfamily)